MSNDDLRELSGLPLLRWLWRQLTSMRTALILLMLLGVAAIPGSLIPQRTQNPMKVREYLAAHPGLGAFLDRLKMFDVYGSPWFSAIYILLFISLIGCVLPRTMDHARALRKAPPLTPRNLDRMEGFAAIDSGNLDLAEAWLRKNRFRIRRDENSISAEKGYMRESGNLLFHLSLILILIGVAIGSLYGYKGEAILNVGERFINTPTSYDTLSFGKLQKESSLQPFTITATKFVAKYDPATNAPQDYSLTVDTAPEVGLSSKSVLIKVNKPLGYGATKIYLQANGYSPVVTVKNSAGDILFQGPVIFLPQDGNLTSTGAIKIADMKPQIGMVGSFVPTYSRNSTRGAFSIFPEVLDPRLLLSVFSGDIGLDSGVPQSVYRLDTSKMKRIALKQLELGQTLNFGEGTITFDGYRSWVNLQIVNDPGKSYALSGGIFALIGLMLSLFTRQRRIWVKVGNQVEIAGLAKNAAPGLADELDALKKWMQA